MEKTPHQLAEERLTISNEFARLGQRKVELKAIFADYYNENRKEHKSDASIERAFDMTKDGLELMVIREKMKAKLMRMSALKTFIDVANMEARNQY